MKVGFILNGEAVTVETDPLRRLIDVLREDFGLTGVKEGCGEGECGACSVLIDECPALACIVAWAPSKPGTWSPSRVIKNGTYSRASPRPSQKPAQSSAAFAHPE